MKLLFFKFSIIFLLTPFSYVSAQMGSNNPGLQMALPTDIFMLEGDGGTVECTSGQIRDPRGYCVTVAPDCPRGETFVGSFAAGGCVRESPCPTGEVEVFAMGGKDGSICEPIRQGTTRSETECEVFSPRSQAAQYEACIREVRSANDRVEAQALAQQQADSSLPSAISDRVSTLSEQCTSAAAPVFQTCTTIAAVAQPADFSGVNNLEGCNALKTNAEATIAGTTSQVNQCISSRGAIQSSCPGITGEVRVVGEATVGSQSARVVAVGSDSVPQNISIRDRALGIIETLDQEIAAANAELSSISSQAEACIARFQEQNQEDPTDVVEEPAPEAQSTADVGGEDTGAYPSDYPSENGEVADGGTSGGESEEGSGVGSKLLNGAAIAAGLMSNTGGPSPGAGTPQSPDYYRANNSTDPTFGSGGGNSGSTGGAYGQNPTNFTSRRDPFIPGRDAKGVENADGAGTLAGGGGGPRGGAGGGGFGGLPQNGAAAAGSGRSGKRNAMAKAKNLINGHKRNKQNGGGASGTLRGNLSPQAMKLAYQKAVKQFGRKMPLKFDGSKYVPDLMAMKNSRNFRIRNARAVAMYKGELADDEMTLDEKLRAKQINPNASHGIFKTMNIYFRRNFKNSSRANGLKL